MPRNLRDSGWMVEDDDEHSVCSFKPGIEEASAFPSLSFSSLQVGECKALDGEEEIGKISFNRWREILESGMALAGIKEESTKANIFKMKAGSKLLDILDNTSNKGGPDALTQPYSNAIYRLEEYFGSRDYLLFQRQKLRSLPQNKDESDLKYVRRVSTIAKLCGYVHDQLVETVADVLQNHARNRKVREVARKAARKGNSLQELLDRVRTVEIEQQAEENFSKKYPTEEASNVLAVSYGVPGSSRGEIRTSTFGYRGRGYFPRSRGGYSRMSGPVLSSSKQCWRCTSTGHQPDHCFAIAKFCHLCRAKGHIQRACTSSRVKRETGRDQDGSPASKIRKIAAVASNDQEEEATTLQLIPAVYNINMRTSNYSISTSSSKLSEPNIFVSPTKVSMCGLDSYVMCSLDFKGIESAGSITCIVAGVEVKF
ncbi:uncharacterized protein LOC121601912 [Anopheles merus]|uniref:uncharacterized protein LOC121601912 n=1 Tax=Anopheles merus TaxID=30066 RepID=UPI001BE47E95|nr:uncharacterized protein LOC121601912 [Anopheles merus]